MGIVFILLDKGVVDKTLAPRCYIVDKNSHGMIYGRSLLDADIHTQALF